MNVGRIVLLDNKPINQIERGHVTYLHVMSTEEVVEYEKKHGHPIPGPHPPGYCAECEIRMLKKLVEENTAMLNRWLIAAEDWRRVAKTILGDETP